MARLNRDGRKLKNTLEGVETFLNVTNTEFEMYFLGVVKKAPHDKERELKRMFRDIFEMKISNTSLAFKARTLIARYNTLKMKWLRTCKQIEEGTYRRQRFMADLNAKNRDQGQGPSAQTLREEIKALVRGDEVPEVQPVARRNARRGHEVGSDALFEQYQDVRRSLGQQGGADRKAMEARLQQRASEVKKKYGCKDVRFDIVEENGRSRVKVIPVT
ncbi:MAG: hypothetical protein CMP23_13280 [Rickettsiales bacterium]|nr:hypothetical protein [Rickettsiales bacterium]|tara:strand:- start:272 stop:922 length:651 start_codon:yes stop_codon:yes gene_type:complete